MATGAFPMFSIVTAVRDGLPLFKKTAPTILNQTFREWEWIIVDDASAPDLAGFVRAINDDRIRYFRQDKGVGQTKALNQAIREARAEWIVRMDGDDLMAINRLERTKAALREAGAAFYPLVFSDYDVIGEEGEAVSTVRYQSPLKPDFYEYMERNNPICHPCVTFFKWDSKHKPYQYDETLNNAQDFALWKHIRRDYNEPFLHIPEPLVSYRLVRGALSGARIREQRAELDAIRSESLADAATNSSRPPLNDRERAGMYSFRKLYYRFVGQNDPVVGLNDFKSLLGSFLYPRMLPKALAFFALRPLAKQVKALWFGGVYK